jgi:RNase P subunit RPR2
VTWCHDCGRQISTPRKARICVLDGDEYVVVVCLGCRSGRLGDRMHRPSELPSRSKVPITGGGEP